MTIPVRADLVAWWSFDEIRDSVVADVSGNGYAAHRNGPVHVVPGVRGNALEFFGEKDSFLVCDNATSLALAIQTCFSVEAWVRRTDTGTMWDGIVCFGESNKGWQLLYGERGQSLTLYLTTDEQGYGPVAGGWVPVDEWMHVAAVFDAETGRARLYQNGRMTADREYRGRIANYPDALYIGKSPGFHAFRGALDEVRVYSHALSSAELQSRYQEFAAGLPPPSPDFPVLFKNLQAVIEGDHVRFTFEKTAAFSQTPEGAGAEVEVIITRTSHPRNDVNPGAGTAETVFRGMLASEDGRSYEYRDPLPNTPGTSYFYRATTDAANWRAGSAKVRRYHPDLWWSPEEIERRLDSIARRFPGQVEIRAVGATVKGRPLRALFAGNPVRRIVLVGAVHVSESGPELMLPAVESLLAEKPKLLEAVGLAVLPCVTLDERERLLSTGYPLYLRKNANGIDLNRNFDAWWSPAVTDPAAETYPGKAPASEPETQALMKLVRQSNPAAVFSFHSVASLSNACFLYTGISEREGDAAYGELCRKVSRCYAEGMYGDEAEKYYSVLGFGSPGTLGSWVYKEFRVPSFDLELDKNELPRRYVYGDAVPVEMLKEYQVRHRGGIERVMEALAAGALNPPSDGSAWQPQDRGPSIP
jgi:murein tripeptide amidase MpaA